MRESNADRYQFHLPATTRDGLKPRRGGLFIATNTHSLFFLFFGGAARASLSMRRTWLGVASLACMVVANGAPPKNKKKGTIYVLPYKPATPTGFVTQADNSEPDISAAKMWVMTSVEMPGYSQVSLRDRQINAGRTRGPAESLPVAKRARVIEPRLFGLELRIPALEQFQDILGGFGAEIHLQHVHVAQCLGVRQSSAALDLGRRSEEKRQSQNNTRAARFAGWTGALQNLAVEPSGLSHPSGRIHSRARLSQQRRQLQA